MVSFSHDEPIAPLVYLSWSWRRFYFAKFRLCNARQFQIGWLTVLVRAKRLWTTHEMFGEHPPEFMVWLDRAYRDGTKGDQPKFTKWNMEVAYLAGRQAERERRANNLSESS